MFEIDDELKEFIESGVIAMVASGDAAGRPHVRYAWAPRVRADARTLDVFLDADRAPEMLKNLKADGRMAVTITHPVSYRSVQFKGRFAGDAPPTAEEMAWVQQGRDAFSVATALVGDPQDSVHNMWQDEVVRVALAADVAYNQTPGPEAGKPL